MGRDTLIYQSAIIGFQKKIFVLELLRIWVNCVISIIRLMLLCVLVHCSIFQLYMGSLVTKIFLHNKVKKLYKLLVYVKNTRILYRQGIILNNLANSVTKNVFPIVIGYMPDKDHF